MDSAQQLRETLLPETVGAKVLVVEDEYHSRISIEMVLEDAGYEISSVENGKLALDEIIANAEDPFDLVILDIQMPVMNGVELLDELTRRGISVNALVITGFGDKTLLIDLLRRGCTDYLDKPFNPNDLQKTVERILEKQRRYHYSVHPEDAGLNPEAAKAIEGRIHEFRRAISNLKTELADARTSYQDLTRINTNGLLLETAHRILPFSEVGGDYINIQNTSVGCDVMLADVSGHDLGASYYALILKSFFEDPKREEKEPIELIQAINTYLYAHNHFERIITALFVRFDVHQMIADVVCAGHPYLIHIREDGITDFSADLNGNPIGMADPIQCDTLTIPVKSGDRFIIYSDGLFYTKGKTHYRKILKAVDFGKAIFGPDGETRSIRQVVDALFDESMETLDHCPADDVSILGIQIP